MSKSLSSFSQYGRTTWQDAEFPILCQTCLGDNPYMRMMKDKFGGECQTCERPYTTFRWCPGKGMRYKKTEVCQTCAKVKNVCQTCLLDLEYGLPVQVRDYALGLKDDIPKHGVNRNYYIQQMDIEAAKSDGTTPVGTLAKLPDQGPNEMLLRLASKRTPYYKRNAPKVCSFWVKGECKRGEECPYRHEKPGDPDDPLSHQKLKDRYYGVNDPVAEKMLNRAKAVPALLPPENQAITTLYVAGLGNDGGLTERDLRDYFYQFGEIRKVKVIDDKGCAFIEYTTRLAAEKAAEKAYNRLVINNRRLMVRWGRPRNEDMSTQAEARNLPDVPGLPRSLPVPDFFNLNKKKPGDKGKEQEGLLYYRAGDPRNPNRRKRQNQNPNEPQVEVVDIGNEGPSFEKMARSAAHSVLGFNPAPFKFQPDAEKMQMPPSIADDAPVLGPPRPDARQQRNYDMGIHYPSQDPQHLGAKDFD